MVSDALAGVPCREEDVGPPSLFWISSLTDLFRLLIYKKLNKIRIQNVVQDIFLEMSQ